MQAVFYKPSDNDKTMAHLFSILKAFTLTTLAALLTWVLPLKSFVAVTLLIVVFDLYTGIQAAKKRGEVIHSKGLRRSITKFTMYVAAILGGHALQTVYFPDFPMVFSISAYISATEFWSVLENVGTVTGTNVLEAVLEKLSKTTNKKE